MSEQSKHHKVSLLLYKLANIVSITTRSNIPALCCGKWRRPTQWKTASLPSPEKNIHLNHENISKGATNQGVEWLELIEFFNSINNLCPNFSFVIQSRRISKKAFETKKKIGLTEKKKKMQRIRLFSQNRSSGSPRSCYVQRLPWGGRIMIISLSVHIFQLGKRKSDVPAKLTTDRSRVC